MSSNMERIMKAQALREHTMGTYMSSLKTFEINPENPTMEKLRTLIAADAGDKMARDLMLLLFETALIVSGFNLDEPHIYANRIHSMVKLGLSLDADEQTEPTTDPISVNDENPTPDAVME